MSLETRVKNQTKLLTRTSCERRGESSSETRFSRRKPRNFPVPLSPRKSSRPADRENCIFFGKTRAGRRAFLMQAREKRRGRFSAVAENAPTATSEKKIVRPYQDRMLFVGVSSISSTPKFGLTPAPPQRTQCRTLRSYRFSVSLYVFSTQQIWFQYGILIFSNIIKLLRFLIKLSS